jgi:hypothetical protein
MTTATLAFAEPLMHDGAPRRLGSSTKVGLLISLSAALFAISWVGTFNRHETGPTTNMFARVRQMDKVYQPMPTQRHPAPAAKNVDFAWPFATSNFRSTGLKPETPVPKDKFTEPMKGSGLMWPFSSATKPAELLGIPISSIKSKLQDPVEVEFLIPVSKMDNNLESAILSENMKPKFWTKKEPEMKEAVPAMSQVSNFKPLSPKPDEAAKRKMMQIFIAKENNKPMFHMGN